MRGRKKVRESTKRAAAAGQATANAAGFSRGSRAGGRAGPRLLFVHGTPIQLIVAHCIRGYRQEGATPGKGV